MMTLTQLMQASTALSESEMIQLNKHLVATIKRQHAMKMMGAASKRYVGEKVSFFSTKDCKTIVGTVTKVNPKTIMIKTNVYGTWRVAATLVKAV
jgi:hypothetical protein